MKNQRVNFAAITISILLMLSPHILIHSQDTLTSSGNKKIEIRKNIFKYEEDNRSYYFNKKDKAEQQNIFEDIDTTGTCQ